MDVTGPKEKSKVDPVFPLHNTNMNITEQMSEISPVMFSTESSKSQLSGMPAMGIQMSTSTATSSQEVETEGHTPMDYTSNTVSDGAEQDNKVPSENMSGTAEKLRKYLLSKREKIIEDPDDEVGDALCEYCRGSVKKRRLCSPMKRFCSKSCAKSYRKPRPLRQEDELLSSPSKHLLDEETFEPSELNIKRRLPEFENESDLSAKESEAVLSNQDGGEPRQMAEEHVESDDSEKDHQGLDMGLDDQCEDEAVINPQDNTISLTQEKGVMQTDPDVKEYLQSLHIMAAPSFSLPCATSGVPGLRPAMKLEVIDRHNPPSYCVATVIKVLGHRVCIRYDGYGNDNSNDMWCKFQADELHPIGWCAENGYPLQPPKVLFDSAKKLAVADSRMTSSLEDWRTFLTRTLTGALAAPSDLFRKYKEPFQPKVHGFQLGMKLEAIHPVKPSVICPATVTKILGPFYFAVTTDFVTNLPSVTLCCHSDTPNILPVGWCFKNGVDLTFPAAYSKTTFTWEKYLTTCRAAPAPGHLFKRVKAHKLKPGMKVETVYLENPEIIGVATITNVMGRILKLSFDGQPGFQYVDSDSPDLFAIGWCSESGHPLHTPFGKIQPTGKPAVLLELKTPLMSFAEVMGKKPSSAASQSGVVPSAKASRSSDKVEVKKDCGEDIEDEGSDLSDDETYSGSERFFHNKNQIFFNKACCIGPLLDPEKVASLPDATPRGKVSTVIRTGLEMVAKCAFHPEKVIELMQAGCGVRVVVKHEGKILKKAISRVDSRPKLERYLKRFCRHLICCEFFLSLKPITNPCPDNCKADGFGNLLGPKGMKAKRSREYFEVKHLGYEKRKRGRKRKIALEMHDGGSSQLGNGRPSVGIQGNNGGVPTASSQLQVKTERPIPASSTISSQSSTFTSSVIHRATAVESNAITKPVLPVPPVTRTITMPLVNTGSGTTSLPTLTTVVRQSAPGGPYSSMQSSPMNRPSVVKTVCTTTIPPPPPLRSRADSLITNLSSQRFATSSNENKTTITFGGNIRPVTSPRPTTPTVFHRPSALPPSQSLPLSHPNMTRPPPPYNPKNVHMYLPAHTTPPPVGRLVHSPHNRSPPPVLPTGLISKSNIVHHHPTSPPPPLTPLSGKGQFSPVATSPRQGFPSTSCSSPGATIELTTTSILQPHSMPHSVMSPAPNAFTSTVIRGSRIVSPNVQVVSGTPVPLTRTAVHSQSLVGSFRGPRGPVYLQGRPGRPKNYYGPPFPSFASESNGFMSSLSKAPETATDCPPVPGQPGYRVQSIKYFGRNATTQSGPSTDHEPVTTGLGETPPVVGSAVRHNEGSSEAYLQAQVNNGESVEDSTGGKSKASMWWLKRKRKRRQRFTVVKKRKETEETSQTLQSSDNLQEVKSELIPSASSVEVPNIVTRRRGRPPKKLTVSILPKPITFIGNEKRRGRPPKLRMDQSPVGSVSTSQRFSPEWTSPKSPIPSIGTFTNKVQSQSSLPTSSPRKPLSANITTPLSPQGSPRVFMYPSKPRPSMSDACTNTTLPGCPLETTLDLPSDPSTWTIEQVVAYIQSTDVTKCAEVFMEQEIDGDSLMLLTQNFLMQFTKIKLGPILKICCYINQLKLRVRHLN